MKDKTGVWKPLKSVTIDGKEILLNGALPLVVADWKALQANGVTRELLMQTDVNAMSKLVLHTINKADASVMAETIDKLTLSELDSLAAKFLHEENIDRPFLTVSTI